MQNTMEKPYTFDAYSGNVPQDLIEKLKINR